MAIYNRLPEDLEEVDVVIAGGGTASCIVAGRLAAADPSLTILVIEGGANNYNVPTIVNPVFYLSNIVPGSKTAIFYQGNKSAALADREPIVPSGGTLGGGSSINFMMYTRAQRDDYDSWKTPGWSSEEVLPFLKKLETYHPEGDSQVHGHDGPIHVSDGTFRSTRAQDGFAEATKQIGYPEIQDLQDLKSNNGYARWYRTVSPEGNRQDTAHAYLHPLLQDGKHPNLHVLVETKVLRVLFDDDKRASGVEFTPNPDYLVATALTHPQKQTVKARKLVIVSSGSCGSPGVLERSGVGSREVLERAGIPLVVDLPGVGHDYQDHHLDILPYRTSLGPDETMDSILSGRVSAEEVITTKNERIGWNGIDIAAKVRPTDGEVAALGSEFQALWNKDFKDKPNRPLMLMGLICAYLGDPTSVPAGQYVSAGNYTAYPYSRGHIHITGPELSDPLDFTPGFLADKDDADVKALVWAYKKNREIMRRTPYYRGEVASGHPKFPPGSKAACVELDAALSEVKDIEYSAEDDAAIEQLVREITNTTWHSLGTNKMAPREELGVVDKDLNVYGVRGLKVIDLSIAPENVGANTNNTAMMIGEKGADIVARELGISFSASGRLV
ncbi:alcohol oxidase-like protein [Cercophora scortea]|uniref:Alcohol oxidase-like protein n=1 Tax=Cercophora scortea TaxID=314031 RepID=A0AAE0INE7_9PEZI|nr:alcohol oxidase-like protein [Cercophora scortea]